MANDDYRTLIDQHLAHLIPERNELPQGLLFRAARFALSKGKRLRPLLTLIAAKAYELPIEKALTPACALEIIHTYSLIHDDLPCMDDDDFRRGKPSLHKAFSESDALLTGDFLLTYAFELLSTDSTQSDKTRLTLTAELAKGAGSEGIIGGQLVDLTQGKDVTEDTLLFIQTKKSASLFATALIFAGVLAEVEPEEIELLRQTGIYLGIAFQFADDLLDGKSASLHLTPQRMQELINFHLAKALKDLYKLHANPGELSVFFHTIIHEKLAEQTSF